jgi:hypothetical protein
MSILYNTPIALRAHIGKNLKNNQPNAVCRNSNTDTYERVVLYKTNTGKTIIQSCRDQKNLQVQPSEHCAFANSNQLLWEQFDVEFDAKGHIFFVSCHTKNVMQCNENGIVGCINTNRLGWEAWTIIPFDMLKSNTTARNALVASACAIGGAVLFPVIGVAAGLMVPAAMSTFGTVVAGVGTFHTPLAAGGCAAVLQYSSAALVTGAGAAAGAFTGLGVRGITKLSK